MIFGKNWIINRNWHHTLPQNSLYPHCLNSRTSFPSLSGSPAQVESLRLRELVSSFCLGLSLFSLTPRPNLAYGTSGAFPLGLNKQFFSDRQTSAAISSAWLRWKFSLSLLLALSQSGCVFTFNAYNYLPSSAISWYSWPSSYLSWNVAQGFSGYAGRSGCHVILKPVTSLNQRRSILRSSTPTIGLLGSQYSSVWLWWSLGFTSYNPTSRALGISLIFLALSNRLT